MDGEMRGVVPNVMYTLGKVWLGFRCGLDGNQRGCQQGEALRRCALLYFEIRFLPESLCGYTQIMGKTSNKK